MAKMTVLQTILADGQKRMMAKVSAFQTRPVGDPKRAMAELEKMRDEFITQALEYTNELEPFRRWTPMFGRQINTTRMQFYLQMRNFKKVDELLPQCLFIDAVSNSVKLSRMYSNDAPLPEIEKAFKKAVSKLRYNQSSLVYSLMAWIYLKKNMPDAAHKTVVEGCRKNENDTLKRNLEKLANKRITEFSNASLGDEWFALGLELPKTQVRRQPPKYSNGRPF